LGRGSVGSKDRRSSKADRIPETLRPQVVRWAQLWGLPGLADEVTVEFSRRFRRSLGLCWPSEARIRLAAFLQEGDPALLDEVLCHELAHVAAYRLHGSRTRLRRRRIRPHGPEWKALMVQAGYEARARFREEAFGLSAPSRAPRARWEHRCPACGAVRMAGRSVPQWRCAACWKGGRSGRLVITRVPAGMETE